MAAYAWTPSALTWLRFNHLSNGLHKQISWKNCLYADNLYFTLYNKGMPKLYHNMYQIVVNLLVLFHPLLQFHLLYIVL